MPQSTSRRLYPRQLRRLAVRFWREGEDRARQGFTKNVSLTGAFVSTPDPAGRGERVRLELSDAGRTALLYAVVVHAHRVPPEFRRFADSAMGLRFLGLDEVVGPFLGEEALQPVAAGEATGGGTGGFPSPSGERGGAMPKGGGTGGGGGLGGGRVPGGARDHAEEVSRGATSGTLRQAGSAGSRDAGSSGSGSGGAAPGGPGPGGGAVGDPASAPPRHEPSASGSRPAAIGGPVATYALSFATGNDFLATYRRDLLNGGLFVTTDRPARLNERVAVDLRLPGASAPTLRVEGRVVQVVDPRPLASGRTAGGMGLELIDPDKVVHRLAPHVAAYQR